jgi:hypothetical protein
MFNKDLIKSFLEAYNQVNRLTAYVGILENKDQEWLKKRLQECLISFERCPTIAEILQTNTQQTADYEQAWQEFKKTCCNNWRYEPMPDWVYTLKKLIGVYEVEEMTDESEKWVKKEFLRIIPSLRSGNIRIIGEGDIYEKIGNTTILIGDKNKLINEKYLLEQKLMLDENKTSEVGN